MAVVNAIWLAVAGNWDGVFRFAVVAGFMLAARGADMSPPFAAAFAVFLLLATWASVQHLYRQIPQFNVLVHVLTPGSLAAVAYFVLVRAALLPGVRSSTPQRRSWAPVVWVVVVGVTAAVFWEFNEWGFEQVAPSSMRVKRSEQPTAAGLTHPPVRQDLSEQHRGDQPARPAIPARRHTINDKITTSS